MASSTLIPLTINPFVLLLSTNLILVSPLALIRSNLAWIRLIMFGFKAQSNGLFKIIYYYANIIIELKYDDPTRYYNFWINCLIFFEVIAYTSTMSGCRPILISSLSIKINLGVKGLVNISRFLQFTSIGASLTQFECRPPVPDAARTRILHFLLWRYSWPK
jgi:hypothetical protein